VQRLTKDFVRSGVSAVPVMVATAAGAMMSLVWMKLSRHYGLLNAGKFKVIHAFERHLPAAPFWAEWVELDEGRNPSKYQSMAMIQWVIPVVFLVVYVLMFVTGLVVFLTYYQ
jgi:hypothetical protein